MPRYAMVIDEERCIGCHACAIACRLENRLAGQSCLRVETAGGRMDVPSGVYPDLTLSYRPIACMHCAEAPCIPACPTEAIYRRGDGVVLIAAPDCNGCAACLAVCPYDAIHLSAERGVAEKCSYCVGRLDAGLPPFCLVCCEGQAIFFGDLDDPLSAVSRLIAGRAAYRLQPEAGTEPATYFCPPLARRGV